MRVFITGGAGFIGSHLVDRLVKDGHEVTVFDNLFRGKSKNLHTHLSKGHIQFIEGDIRSYDALRKAIEHGCDVCYHLAAQSNVMGAVQDLDYSFETNVIGTYNTLKAAAANKVKRVVFSSSRESYGEAQTVPVNESHPLTSKNSYGASKVAGETYCRVFAAQSDLEVAVLRFSNVYGERDFNRVIPIFFNNIKAGKNLTIFGGKQVIDFVSTDIIVEALVQSADNHEVINGPVNVGSGQGTTLFELAERLKKVSGGSFKIEVLPARTEEVVRFVADVNLFRKVFDIDLPKDPLYMLERMWAVQNR